MQISVLGNECPTCEAPYRQIPHNLLIIFVFYTAREYKFPRVNISFVISGHQNNNAEVKEGNLVDPKIFRSINQAKQVSSN